MTDIQYYIDNDDIYSITKNLNNGTVIAGSCHVPKYLDRQKHNIMIGDKIEGTIRLHTKIKNVLHQFEGLDDEDALVLNKMRTLTENGFKKQEMIDLINQMKTDTKRPEYAGDYEWLMTMEMYGNDHVYTHDNHMYYLTRGRINIIPTTKETQYILKLIVDDRYDLEGTEYIRYHIVKIDKPKLQDTITEGINTTDRHNLFNIRENLEKLTWKEVPKMRRCGQEQQAILKKQIEDAKNFNLKSERALAKITQKLSTPEDKCILYNNDIQPPQSICVEKQDNTVIIYKHEYGRLINYYKQQMAAIPAQLEKKVLLSSKTLLNKIVTKMLGYKKIESQTFRDLITYINREQPGLDTITHVIPLLVSAIGELAQSEIGIMLLTSSKIVQDINDYKDGKYSVLPENIYDAFQKGKTLEYINYQIRQAIGVNVQNTTNPTKSGF